VGGGGGPGLSCWGLQLLARMLLCFISDAACVMPAAVATNQEHRLCCAGHAAAHGLPYATGGTASVLTPACASCRSTRPEAPYLPSNIEYMANNNGLSSKEEVRKACFEASYLVGA
jgi:hypothetical protein